MNIPGVALLRDADIRPVDALMLRPDGLLNVVPTWKLKEFEHNTLQVWCVKRGIYQFPTEELLDWLSVQIAGRKAIEICAGNGVLGRELGIPATDNYMQTMPELVAHYKLMGQEPITPPPDVRRFDSNQAVRHFRPEVVIGAWVTQLGHPGEDYASAVGTDELTIIQSAKYVHIGNGGTHARKRIMGRKHATIQSDWLVSRAIDQSLNHACVWG